MEAEKRNTRILVVEDDKFLRSIMLQKLSRDGFKVMEAADGAEALKKIKEAPPQLILLDLVLPDMDGFEVLHKLKEKEDTAKIPVLILSNLGGEEDIRKGKELGAKDYLIKAYFTPSEIVEKAKKILRESYF